MSLKKVFGEEFSNAITSDDILGKEVIDSEGEFLGVVEMIHMDPMTVDVIGISIDKGFLRKGLVVGKQYIERVTPHAVFLKIRPVYKLKGMMVFDSKGEKLGSVTKVVLHENKNEIRGLIVHTGIAGKNITITSDMIQNIGYNVLLKNTKDNLRFAGSTGQNLQRNSTYQRPVQRNATQSTQQQGNQNPAVNGPTKN